MKKGLLYCLRQKVFFKGLLVERHVIPTKGCEVKDTNRLEVDILEVLGNKALVLLPNIMANGEHGEENTALVDMRFIE